jgi:hypothetical protein
VDTDDAAVDQIKRSTTAVPFAGAVEMIVGPRAKWHAQRRQVAEQTGFDRERVAVERPAAVDERYIFP